MGYKTGMNIDFSKKVCVGLIGAGAVSRIFYIPAFQSLGDESCLKLRFIVDTSRKSLSKLTSLTEEVELIKASFSDFFANLKWRKELDAVIIALPTFLHESAVCNALENGLHVLCEKPLSMTEDSLEKMLSVAKKTGKIFAAGQIRRFSRAARAIHEIIISGMLGNCKSITWEEGEVYEWPIESFSALSSSSGGDAMFDMGGHIFDVLCFWLGPFEVKEYCDDSRGGIPSSFKVNMESRQGVVAKVDFSRISYRSNLVDLVFEQGRVQWDLDDWNNINIETSNYNEPLKRLALTKQEPAPDKIGLFAQQIQDFGRAIIENRRPFVSAQEARGYISIFDRCNTIRKKSKPISAVIKDDLKPLGGLENVRAAVTGAAGFIGCRLVEILQAREQANVLALAHRPQSCVRLARNKVKIEPADILNQEQLSKALRNIRILFHCAIRWGSKEDIWETVIKGTENILKAANENGVEAVIILSSMLAYGDPPLDGVVDENSRVNSQKDIYGKAKREMERRCLKFSKKSRMRIVILEPTCVFGPFSKTFVIRPAQELIDGKFFLIEEGRGLANLIYIDNLIDAMVLAATHPRARYQRFIVNEQEPKETWKDYFTKLFAPIWRDNLPSLTRGYLMKKLAIIEKEKNPLNIFRQAIHNYPPAGQLVAHSFLFKLWKLAKKAVHREKREDFSSQIEQSANKDSVEVKNLESKDLYISKTFISLYDSQAVYCSNLIQDKLGWRPRIGRQEAMKRTIQWLQEYGIFDKRRRKI